MGFRSDSLVDVSVSCEVESLIFRLQEMAFVSKVAAADMLIECGFSFYSSSDWGYLLSLYQEETGLFTWDGFPVWLRGKVVSNGR